MSLLIENVDLKGEEKDIYIEQGKIAEVGNDLTRNPDKLLKGKGKVALPSFSNWHTHAGMSLLRGYGDDETLRKWLEEKIWPIEDEMNPKDIYWGTKLACLEMIKTGTGFFSDMYMFPEAALEAAKEIGLKAELGLVTIGDDPGESKDFLKKTYQKLTPELTEKVSLSVAPHAAYSTSEEVLKVSLEFAKEKELPLHIHLAETEKDVRECVEKTGVRPVSFLDKLGFLSQEIRLAHGVWLNKEEIKLISEKSCKVVYNPTSNMKLSVGDPFNYSEFKNQNGDVFLGTDGPASNNNLDMFEEMKFASLLQKHVTGNPKEMPAEEVFDLATDGRKIEPGRKADIMLVSKSAKSLTPGLNVKSDLVYSAGGEIVTDLIVGGDVVMENKKVEGEEKIKEEAKKRAESLIK